MYDLKDLSGLYSSSGGPALLLADWWSSATRTCIILHEEYDRFFDTTPASWHIAGAGFFLRRVNTCN